MTTPADQVLNLAAALEQMVPVLGLSPADAAQAVGLVAQLREAAEDVEADPGRLQRLLGEGKAVAVAGTGQAAGTGVVALAEMIAQSL